MEHVEQKIWRKVEGAVEGVQCLYPPGGVLAVKVVADRPCDHRDGGPGARSMEDGTAPKKPSPPGVFFIPGKGFAGTGPWITSW